jgi:hypothetical protein
MAKNIQLFSPTVSSEREYSNVICTDWTLCMFCQCVTEEKLQNPDGRKNTVSGYESLAKRLEKFHELGEVPLNFKVQL